MEEVAWFRLLCPKILLIYTEHQAIKNLVTSVLKITLDSFMCCQLKIQTDFFLVKLQETPPLCMHVPRVTLRSCESFWRPTPMWRITMKMATLPSWRPLPQVMLKWPRSCWNTALVLTPTPMNSRYGSAVCLHFDGSAVCILPFFAKLIWLLSGRSAVFAQGSYSTINCLFLFFWKLSQLHKYLISSYF